MLWIGWFGFNGGSVGSIATKESADTVALTIFNTNTTGLAGALSADIFIYLRYKLFDITMILNDALGGLVAITAGADLFNTIDSLVIGVIGGTLVVIAVLLFYKVRIDDPVGALSVHLVNGIWGTLAVGLFASSESVALMNQIKSIAVIGILVFTISYAVIYTINKFMAFRAEDDAQLEGLDVSECGIESYPEFRRTI